MKFFDWVYQKRRQLAPLYGRPPVVNVLQFYPNFPYGGITLLKPNCYSFPMFWDNPVGGVTTTPPVPPIATAYDEGCGYLGGPACWIKGSYPNPGGFWGKAHIGPSIQQQRCKGICGLQFGGPGGQMQLQPPVGGLTANQNLQQPTQGLMSQLTQSLQQQGLMGGAGSLTTNGSSSSGNGSSPSSSSLVTPGAPAGSSPSSPNPPGNCHYVNGVLVCQQQA